MPGIDSAVRTVTYAAQHTTANLGASATYTGPTIDGGADPETWPTRTRPTILHLTSARSAHAQLVLQESSDGTTWRDIKSSPIPADGEVRSFDWPLHSRYHRFVLRNGSQAQTAMRLASIALRGEGSSVDEHENLSFNLDPSPLAASATYFGPVFDLGPNSSKTLLRAFAQADQNSATGGLRIQWSADGSNWIVDGVSAATVVGSGPASHGMGIESRAYARYARPVYFNGTAAQTLIRYLISIVSL